MNSTNWFPLLWGTCGRKRLVYLCLTTLLSLDFLICKMGTLRDPPHTHTLLETAVEKEIRWFPVRFCTEWRRCKLRGCSFCFSPAVTRLFTLEEAVGTAEDGGLFGLLPWDSQGKLSLLWEPQEKARGLGCLFRESPGKLVVIWLMTIPLKVSVPGWWVSMYLDSRGRVQPAALWAVRYLKMDVRRSEVIMCAANIWQRLYFSCWKKQVQICNIHTFPSYKYTDWMMLRQHFVKNQNPKEITGRKLSEKQMVDVPPGLKVFLAVMWFCYK